MKSPEKHWHVQTHYQPNIVIASYLCSNLQHSINVSVQGMLTGVEQVFPVMHEIDPMQGTLWNIAGKHCMCERGLCC